MGMEYVRLMACDFLLAFMWVTSGALMKLSVASFIQNPPGEALRTLLSVLNMFFFAWLGNLTAGASYNPLTILSSAITGSFSRFLFTLLVRIPAQANTLPLSNWLMIPDIRCYTKRTIQVILAAIKFIPHVIGSVSGVRLIVTVFPQVGHGPRLKVDIPQGAVTEGLLTFVIVIVSMSLKHKDPKSFFMKTWISSISKLTLHTLGSDFTGGCMNPASAFGWAFSRGDHMTKEHLFVYWLGPLEGTILGAWVYSLITRPYNKHRKIPEGTKKSKSE